MAMMAMTTSNSINVKAGRGRIPRKAYLALREYLHMSCLLVNEQRYSNRRAGTGCARLFVELQVVGARGRVLDHFDRQVGCLCRTVFGRQQGTDNRALMPRFGHVGKLFPIMGDDHDIVPTERRSRAPLGDQAVDTLFIPGAGGLERAGVFLL